jgi:uncharacterized protein YjdB
MSVTPTLGTFKINTNSFTYDGVTTFIEFMNPTSNSGGAFSYTSSNNEFLTVSVISPTVNRLNLIKPGALDSKEAVVTITVVQEPFENYTGRTRTLVFTYSKQTLLGLVDTTNRDNRIVGDVTPLTATVNNPPEPTTISFASQNSSVASVSITNGEYFLQSNSTGTTTIFVYGYSTNYYAATNFLIRVLNTYTLSPLSYPAYVLKSNNLFNAAYTAPSVNTSAFTYTSSNSSMPINSTTGRLTVNTTGTTTITVTQASDNVYIAQSVSATLAVYNANNLHMNIGAIIDIRPQRSNPFVQPIIITSSSAGLVGITLNSTYTGTTLSEITTAYDPTSLLYKSQATLTVTDVETLFTGTGVFQITQEQNGSYEPKTRTYDVSVDIKTAVITIPLLSSRNVFTTFTLPTRSSISTGDGALTWSASPAGLVTIDNNTTVTCNNVGTVTLTATQVDGNNFFGTTASRSFNIDPISPNLTLSYSDFTFTGTNKTFPLTYISESSNPVTFSTTSPNVITIDNVDKTYTLLSAQNANVSVTAVQEAGGYYSEQSATTTFTVSLGAAQPISFTVNGILYGPFENNSVVDFIDVPFQSSLEFTPSSDNADGTYNYSTTSSIISHVQNLFTVNGTGSGNAIIEQSEGSFYSNSTLQINFNCVQILPTITFNVLTQTYVPLGTFSIPSATSASTGEFHYTTDTPDVITISGTTVTLLSAGTASIMATQDADSNYLTNSSTTTFEIQKATPVLSNFNNVSLDYQTTFPLVAESTNTETLVDYVSSDTSVASVEDGVVTAHTTGNCIITATQIETLNYAALAPVTITVVVTPLVPVIDTVALPPIVTYGDDPFTIPIPFSTNLEIGITYTSSDPSVATISDTTVIIHAAGSTNIVAHQAASTNFLAGSSFPVVLTVMQEQATIGAFTMPSKTYGDAPFQIVLPEYTAETDPILYDSSDPSVATVDSSGLVTIVQAGTTTITLSQDANSNYIDPLPQSYLFTVTPSTPILGLFLLEPKTYGNDPFVLQPPTSSNTDVTTWTFTSSDETVATIDPNTNTLTIVGVGFVNVQATQAADVNHYEAASNLATLFVNQATPVLTFTVLTQTYAPNETFQLTASSTNTETIITYSTSSLLVDVSDTTVLMLGAGTVTIDAHQDATPFFTAVTQTATFTIERATSTLIFPVENDDLMQPFVLNKPITLAAFSTNSSGNVFYTSDDPNVLLVVDSVATIQGVGSATITANLELTENYTSATATSAFTITLGTPNFTFSVAPEDQTQTFELYKTIALNAFSTNSLGDIIYSSSNSSVLSVTETTATVEGTGSTTITATLAAAGNYTEQSISVTFTIEEAPVDERAFPTLTFDVAAQDLTLSFQEEYSFDLIASSNSSGDITFTSSNPNVLSVNGISATITGVGTTTITATLAGTDMYHEATANQTFTIGKALRTGVIFNLDENLYSQAYGPNKELVFNKVKPLGVTMTLTTSDPDIASVVGDSAYIQNLGTVFIQAFIAETANYLAWSSEEFDITITKSHPFFYFFVPPEEAVQDYDPEKTFTLNAVSENNDEGKGMSTMDVFVGATGLIAIGNYEQHYLVSSGLITFHSSNESIVSVSDNLATVHKAGFVMITATIAETEFIRSRSIERQIIIHKISPTITLNIPDFHIYPNEDNVYTISITSPEHYESNSDGVIQFSMAINKQNVSILDNVITISEPIGNINITINLKQEASINYASKYNTFDSFLVSSYTAVIQSNLQQLDGVYASVGSSFPLTYTSTGDGAVHFDTDPSDIISISNQVVSFDQTGFVRLTLRQDNGATYFGTSETVSFVVVDPNLSDPTFSFPVDDVDKIQSYSVNKLIALNAITNSDGAITYTSSNPSVLLIQGTNAVIKGVGEVVITAVLEGSSTYNGGLLTQTFLIQKAVPNFSFPVSDEVKTQQFTGPKPFALNASSTDSDGEISYSPIGTFFDAVHVRFDSTGYYGFIQRVGSNLITATIEPTEFYLEKSISVLFTIYDVEPPLVPTFTFEVAPEDAQQAYVLDKPIALNASSSDSTGDITYSSSNPSVLVIDGTSAVIKGAGTALITATIASTVDYTQATLTTTFHIDKATPTFSSNWTIPTKQRGGLPFEITGLTSTNTVTTIHFTSSNPNVATVSDTTVTIVAAGSTTITATQESTANYNAPTPVSATFTVTDPTIPESIICFVAGTPVETDQGAVPIETLDPERHTIRNKRIVGVTKTWSPHAWLVEFEPHALGENKPTARTVMSMYHKVDHDGVMTSASRLINGTTIKKVPYNRETLYNVLQDEHGTMIVNNVVCETLHPDNITAKLFRLLNALPWEEQVKHVSTYNAFCKSKNMYAC